MKHTSHDRILRRKKRISKAICGSKNKPRISIYRSNKYVYAQAIDDEARVTIAACSGKLFQKDPAKKLSKADQAKQVGVTLGKILLEKKINSAVFDRGQYSYLGRVKNLADGLREAGIKV